MLRPAVIFLMLFCGCTQHGRAAIQQCALTDARALSPESRPIAAGSYRLAFVGVSGSARGRRVEGRLILRDRPADLRPVLSLDLTPVAGVSEPLYGTTSADITVVGAYSEGSLLSEDPAQPGVAVRIDDRPSSRTVELRFGSGNNVRDRHLLDASLTVAQVLEIDATGFFGVWNASRGIADYDAGGYFCAIGPE